MFDSPGLVPQVLGLLPSASLVATAAPRRPALNSLPVFLGQPSEDGPFIWEATVQSTILSSFFYGYVVTQIPLGILAKR